MDFKPMQAKGGKDFKFEDAMAKCVSPIMEIKYDGWRLLAFVEEDGVHMYSRTAIEYTDKIPHIEAEIARIFPVGTILDGEIVDLADQECTAVTNVFGKSKATATTDQILKLTYVCFDIIQHGQYEDIVHDTLQSRKSLIVSTLEDKRADARLIQTSKWYEATEATYNIFIDQGLEGAIIKCTESTYKKGKRGHGWFKLKYKTSIDVVIMELPINGKNQFEGQVGHMIVGQYDENGNLVQRAHCNPPNNAERQAMTDAPLDYIGRVLELKHYGYMIDGFRHPTFTRWREDKDAEDCTFDNG